MLNSRRKTADEYCMKGKPAQNTNETVAYDPTMMVTVPIECISAEIPLPYPIYIKIQDRFVLFRSAHDVLTERRMGTLHEKAADLVYIPKSEWVHFISTQEQREKIPTDVTRIWEAHLKTRFLCLAYLRDVEEKKELFRYELLRYRAATDRLAESIALHPSSAKHLIRRYPEADFFFTNHSVNTMVYSLAIGKELNLSSFDMKLLAFAALFHNIGNTRLPEELLNAPQGLGAKERNRLRTHTIKGSTIMEGLELPPEMSKVAYQHHEMCDGSGYPLQIAGSQIHPLAKICSIARVYDELQSKTPYSEPLTLDEAKEWITKHAKKFDAAMVAILGGFDF
jgi:putative nucleotidyltransferase with HDIG domain